MTKCPVCDSPLDYGWFQEYYDGIYGDTVHFRVCHGHGFFVEGLGWANGSPYLNLEHAFRKLFSFSSVPP